MTSALDDIRAATELIALGLRSGARPTDGNRYGTLLDRYRADGEFREVVEASATGLGLIVLGGLSRTGLVLTTQEGSVFAVRLSDLRSSGLPADERLVAGLILLGVAAYAFPREADLDSTEVKIIEVGRLDRFIRDAVRQVAAVAGDEDSTDGQARRAADIYDRMSAFKPKEKQSGSARGSTQYAITEVLGWLVDRGAARASAQMGPTTYQLTDRFRLLVADVAGGEALEALRRVRRDTEGK